MSVAVVLNTPSGSGTLDTLAQLHHLQPCTSDFLESKCRGQCIEKHELSEKTNGQKREGISPDEILRKRARAKFVGLPIVMALIRLNSPLKGSYLNSYGCCSVIEQKDGQLTTRYCKNRWCIPCCRIRAARAIRKYYPHLSAFEDPQFVTLTVPNVKGSHLAAKVGRMKGPTGSWAMAKQAVIRQGRRVGFRFQGVCKFEVTYNAGLDSYHPHFHVIVEGQRPARALVRQWLRLNPRAAVSAQDVRPANERSMLEMFKYFTKMTTKGQCIPARNLDVIFRAVRRRRVFQPFGMKGLKSDSELDEEFRLDQTTPAIKRLEENLLWHWQQDLHDWIDLKTGDTLTDFEPTKKDRQFVENYDPVPADVEGPGDPGRT